MKELMDKSTICRCGHSEYRHEYTPLAAFCYDCTCQDFEGPLEQAEADIDRARELRQYRATT